jgi:hypothetical protein
MFFLFNLSPCANQTQYIMQVLEIRVLTQFITDLEFLQLGRLALHLVSQLNSLVHERHHLPEVVLQESSER